MENNGFSFALLWRVIVTILLVGLIISLYVVDGIAGTGTLFGALVVLTWIWKGYAE